MDIGYERLPQLDAHLVRCTHEIDSAVTNAKVYLYEQQEYLRKAATVGCDALGVVLYKWEDPLFRDTLDNLQANWDNKLYGQILDDFDRFEDFLYQDKRLLIEVGRMDEGIADKLFNRARLLFADIRAHKYGPGGSEELLGLISELRDETCHVASELQQEEQQRIQLQQQEEQQQIQAQEQQEKTQRRHRFLRKVAFAVGGVTIITVNAVADAGLIAVSFGAFPVPVATSLSSTVGQTLVGAALPVG